MKRGPKKGSKFADILEMSRFLKQFKSSKQNIYALYHKHYRNLHFDLKKIYRYLRYALKLDLLELQVEASYHPLPTKWYSLTEKGEQFLALNLNSCNKTITETKE